MKQNTTQSPLLRKESFGLTSPIRGGIVLIIALFLFPPQWGGSGWGFSQNIAINTTGVTPDASSMLDVSSASKGMLIPRVSLTQTTLASPVTSPATSLLVYNTATANDVTPGFYYWDGIKWVKFITSNVSQHCYTCDGW